MLQSPSLAGGPVLTSKIPDDAPSGEPLRVENRGAWSMLAKKPGVESSPVHPRDEAPAKSSLWMSARSMEQQKQQKQQQLEKERSEEMEAQRRREQELREQEKAREREDLARRKRAQEAAVRAAAAEEEEQAREEARRVQQQHGANDNTADKKTVSNGSDVGGVEPVDDSLTEDLQSFSSSSFL